MDLRLGNMAAWKVKTMVGCMDREVHGSTCHGAWIMEIMAAWIVQTMAAWIVETMAAGIVEAIAQGVMETMDA